MNRCFFMAILAVLVAGAGTHAEVEYTGEADGLSCSFVDGRLAHLQADGTPHVFAREMDAALLLRRLDGDRAMTADRVVGDAVTYRPTDLDEPGTRVVAHYGADADELTVRHEVVSEKPGVWGVTWSIGSIRLDRDILLPAVSGMRLTKDSPGRAWSFDYPISWTNQIVIVEGAGGGFYVWAEDTDCVFKRVEVKREEDGWRIDLTTMARAPFDDKTGVPELTWRVGAYEGDWRVPARRYRDWTVEHMMPVPVAEQTPEWVQDTRNCVIMGQDLATLEVLARRLDPAQTMIYLPSWRAAGYDRNYPEYDDYLPGVREFIERAHALGFKVMLHVNYFGVDPLNPLYEQFEPYQVRSPFGEHDKEWWLWERADPVIKFAYINPACQAWRDLFTERMAALCEDLKVDALHLDQTLCIYNDHNGLIDGMTMAEGALALHRQLRERLPHVALSGEGLNEITMRHEAFAQRHAWGLNHADGTYHVPKLRMAHPIASYLMRPFTVLYGYLGCAPPTTPDLYCAWDEATRYWGIIPTLKPNRAALENPDGFTRQFLDEANFYTRERIDPDLDGAWPDGVAFPYRTAAGRPAWDMADGSLLFKGKTISRTVYGREALPGPGNISGWRGYNADGIIGLEPTQWYPCVNEPRDPDALHVTALPEGFTLGGAVETEALAFVSTRPNRASDLRLADLLDEARCGSRPFEGDATEVKGPLYDNDDGAFFQPMDDGLWAHPPWKGGTGVAYARFDLDLPPGVTRFITEVALAEGAVGEDRSDGVTFIATLRAEGQEASASVHAADTERAQLLLELSQWAGKAAVLELTVDPGPDRSPSFDWARWYGPRIERNPETRGEVGLAGLDGWRQALGDRGMVPLEGRGALTLETRLPGTVFLLREPPAPVVLPLDLTAAAPVVTLVSDAGTVLPHAQYAGIQPVTASVEGADRPALFAHPPDFGQTRADYPMTLPEGTQALHAWTGLRAGAEEGDATFLVEVNGVTVARHRAQPGPWKELTCDLSPWAGKPVVLSLITDSNGTYTCDWATWVAPELR